MTNANSETNLLHSEIPQTGTVCWIGVSPTRRAELNLLDEVTAEVGTGLVGDHHAQSGKSKREVTFIQQEHLQAVASLLGVEEIDPLLTRRNVVVSGINLIALKKRLFRVGNVLLQGTGPCAPCSRMEENLGPGGYQAMRGHGGITAKVIEPGSIRVGDSVTAVQDAEDDESE